MFFPVIASAAKQSLALAQQSLARADQSLRLAQKQLTEATLTAPFDGIVAKVSVKEGDTVTALSTIIHEIDLSSVELEAKVDELDILRVKLGQEVVITADALPEAKIEGKVISTSILPTVEAGVVSYSVTIGFNNPADVSLKIGMSATADIIIDKRTNALLIPARAIKTDSQGKTVVSVMVNQQVKEKPIIAGISDGLETEVVSGLEEGETVVIETRPTTQTGGLFGG